MYTVDIKKKEKVVSFSDDISQLHNEVTKLGSIMDEAENLEFQKLKILGFDQENILELEISIRFNEQVQLIKQLYQTIFDTYPNDLINYQASKEGTPTHALEAFRSGKAETAHFWDLFGEQ